MCQSRGEGQKMDGQKQNFISLIHSMLGPCTSFSFDCVYRLNLHLIVHSTDQGLDAQVPHRNWGKNINMEAVNEGLGRRRPLCQFLQHSLNLTRNNVPFASILLLSKCPRLDDKFSAMIKMLIASQRREQLSLL